MPTPEEIKKIAVSYSVSRPAEEMPTNPAMAQMIVADALKWLSKDFVIVPKSKVKEWQGIVENALKADQVITEPAFRFMWERLFNEEKQVPQEK